MEKEIAPEKLAALQDAHEQTLRELLLGKRLDTTFVYTFQARPADQVDDHSLLVFGGMELVVEGQTLSFGFNISMELMDMQPKEFAKVSGGVPITLLPQDLLAMLKSLEGLAIQSCAFKWMHYFELDEEFEPVEDPSFAPMELILEFEGGEKLQLAGVHFQLTPEGEMVDLTYHPEGALLISRGGWTDIADPAQAE